MNKKYEGILKVADNVGSAAVLTICIAILRIVMNPGLQSVEIKDIIVNYSGSGKQSRVHIPGRTGGWAGCGCQRAVLPDTAGRIYGKWQNLCGIYPHY